MSRHAFRLLFAAAFICSIFRGTAHAQIPQIPSFDALYVFGDSLADNGNDLRATQAARMNPAVPPSASPHKTYFEGRFSNGYVAPEFLWQLLSGNAPGSPGGLKPFLSQPLLPLGPAVDFAFGGTGTPYLDQTPGGFYAPGLKGQVELYRTALQSVKKPKRPLFVIVTGANDYRVDQFNVPLPIDQVVTNIVDAVETLYRSGARDVMVLNLPDLGLVPGESDPQSATALSLAHNAALKSALDALHARYPNLRIVQPDLIEAFDQLPAWKPEWEWNQTTPLLEVLFANDPTLPPGFPMSACLFIDPLTCKDSPAPFNVPLPLPVHFVFWDIVHPTTEAHAYLAQYLYLSLTKH